MKNILLYAAAGAMLLLAGCQHESIPAEDPRVLTVYADEIAILQDPYLATNSPEKFNAAKVIAENVDFSFLRNVRTIEDIFLPSDAMQNKSQTEVGFYYPYKQNSVRFRFYRHDNIVIRSDVEVK